MISTLIALPYELARRPLVAISDGLAGRLAEDAAPRVALDKAIGSADQVAGSLLRNVDISRRGDERLERSHKLATAARLERRADATRDRARTSQADAQREAERTRAVARERIGEGLAEADLVEARGKHQARTRAAGVASAKKATADRKAADQKAAARRRKTATDRAAASREGAATRKAKGELEEARADRDSAAQARADAERLEELTAAKKAARKRS